MAGSQQIIPTSCELAGTEKVTYDNSPYNIVKTKSGVDENINNVNLQYDYKYIENSFVIKYKINSTLMYFHYTLMQIFLSLYCNTLYRFLEN
jgi:hypothetical protein